MSPVLAFIGGGNMARSLIGGLLERGWRAQQIVVADPLAAQRDALQSQLAIRVTDDNAAAARGADVVVLAVKPQEMQRAVQSMAQAIMDQQALIISVAAGIRASDIQRWLPGIPVVRAMPNRPALQGCGMTGLYATTDVSTERRALAEQILGAVGATLWLEREQHMDIVTAVSASGPAYFFLLIEMLEQAGVTQGLAPEVSRRLAIETAYGSGAMARAASESPAVLRQQVTSKGGTTEAALRELEARHIRAAFEAAVAAATRRAAELADEFGSQR
ncbi:MAG TPA: pyrroline-5-carboxylate reductase [Steroidobacteraceae bacterium]|nr:pyrroline-5-carboxylate reductase [Steroidobacteraceae bacterium]